MVALLALAACSAGPSGPATVPGAVPPEPADSATASGEAVHTTAAPRPAPVPQPVPTRALPTDLTPAPSGCAGRTLPSGWLAAENALPGTPQVAAVPGSAGRSVLGYLSASSAACGDHVSVQLAGPTQTVRLVAYRLGAYAGVGSRFVWQSGDVDVTTRPTPERDPVTRLIEPVWPASYEFVVDEHWLPGMYALLPLATSGAGALGPPIPFVVRDDAGREPLLMMASTLTWNAYGDWGGWSLYFGRGTTKSAQVADRARVVSLRRPLTGSGLRSWQTMDLPLVSWLETLGVDVAYTTDVALDGRPSTVLQHAALLTGGHSEYWTTRMYDTLEAALHSGVGVAMFGGNNVWWQARLEASGTRMAVYRSAAEDPLSTVDPPATTVLWSRPPLSRSWAAVSGQSHAGVGVTGGLVLVQPPSWLVAGTDLADGSVLPGAVGGEADGFHPAAVRPLDLQVLAAGVVAGSEGPATVSVNYVTTPSGGALFTAGTTSWSCQLDPQCPSGSPARTRAAVAAMTRNIVTAFAAGRPGAAHPAQDVVVPGAAVLATTLPKPALGGYGPGSD